MEVAQESVTAVIQGSDSAAGFADLTDVLHGLIPSFQRETVRGASREKVIRGGDSASDSALRRPPAFAKTS